MFVQSGSLEPPDTAKRDPTAAVPESPFSSHDRQTAFNSAGRRAKASSCRRRCGVRDLCVADPTTDVVRVRDMKTGETLRAAGAAATAAGKGKKGDGLLARRRRRIRPHQVRERGNESESGWTHRPTERERERLIEDGGNNQWRLREEPKELRRAAKFVWKEGRQAGK